MLDLTAPVPSSAPARARQSARTRQVRTATFAGLGVAFPETVVENGPIAARVGVSGDWIERRTGIRRRRHAQEHETTATLGAAAALAALTDADLTADDVDLVIAATDGRPRDPRHRTRIAPPRWAPGRPRRIDLGAACSGFLGRTLPRRPIESGRADTVVLIGVEVLSRFLDPGDKGTAPIFGDGAGAAS